MELRRILFKILLFSILLLCVLAVTSCKKAETKKREPETIAVKTVGKGVEEVSDKSAAKLVAIPLTISKPVPGITPVNIAYVDNLEKPSGYPRADFLAPEGTVNVALNKLVTSSDDMPIIGDLRMVTDGNKEGTDGCYVELAPFKQHVTIDLEGEYNIYAVLMWHQLKDGRAYLNVVVQTVDDAEFSRNVNTIFNNDTANVHGLGIGTEKNYIETGEGKLIDAGGVKGRYVRFYSNGNCVDELNHYIELEVWGKKVK